MERIIVLIFIGVIISGVTYSQRIEVPLLEEVKTEDDLHLFISIGLSYDEDQELVYKLDELETNRIDSIKPYIKRKLRSKPDFYVNTTAIEIIADKNISIYDFEMLQEEVKRLGFLKVFYVAESEIFSRIPNIWSTGYFFKLPSRDDDRIQKFYSDRGLNFRESENLCKEEIDRRLNLRKVDITEEEKNLNLPPPRIPPPPPPELPKKFDEAVKKEFKDYRIVIIEIDSKNSFTLEGIRQLAREDIKKVILDSLEYGKCLFVLRKDEKAIYDDYLFVLVTIRNAIYKRRNQLSNAKYEKEYSKLKLEYKREIVDKYPMIILDEPNYIKE